MTLCPSAPIKTILKTLFLCFLLINSTARIAVPTPNPAIGRVLFPVLGSISVLDVSLTIFSYTR